MTNSFKYLLQNKIMKLSDYPYTGYQGSCKYSSSRGLFGTTGNGYVNVAKNSNSALRQAIAQQPVSVAIQASSSTFRYYNSGIITSSNCGTSLDHAVLAVGYGSENG